MVADSSGFLVVEAVKSTDLSQIGMERVFKYGRNSNGIYAPDNRIFQLNVPLPVTAALSLSVLNHSGYSIA